MQKHTIRTLFPTGAMLVLIASLLRIFADFGQSVYIYGVGTLALIIYHAALAFGSDKKSALTSRQYRIGLFASLFLAVGTYFMYTDSNSWVVTTLIYAVITLYLSFRIKE